MSTTTSTDRTTIDKTAASVFGWDELHPAQLEAIEAVLAERDVLALMPTGFGKSAIYQVAGAVLGKPVVVVSPLIALQADQVAGLVGHPEAPAAIAINSSHTDSENAEGWERLEAGEITYVFLAPEQLASPETVARLAASGVGLLVVDEAHCVSSWGHDFRPDYLHLGQIVADLGRPPVLALTATGSGPIRDEIVERLRLRDPLVLSHGFDRPNLSLAVTRHEDDQQKRDAVVEDATNAATPAIVYVATRKETGYYADALSKRRPDLTVVAYHGGQSSAERGQVHERFHAGDVGLVVATSAFGMGIDKPDIRAVIHADVPDSLESYYQEIGRAGRDGEPASATLHYRPEDLALRSFFASGLPRRSHLRAVFTTIQAAGRPVTRTAVAEQLSHTRQTVTRLIDLLLEAETIIEKKRGFVVRKGLEAAEAADSARHVAKTRERVEKTRQDMMRNYAEQPGCRRHTLLGYFGEDSPERCGNCDGCAREADGPRVDDAATSSGERAFPVDSHVRHEAWGEGTVMSHDGDRMTVFFDEEGYKVLATDEVLDRALLVSA
ncbi:ATP-dependent DNA helicase RecQ [Frondihabitans sp. PhB188]|uniref:RecQ family ATP-dependent DNA helicase n=1 Tax=Frondihabitans sp. PhB188 TaxID=2485200 RepID=UPI000F4621EC|nr:RecQ family ATP-dependent DNA helicase [Frondihabitans sp. PhB188]ROQ37026.1 ATP-dependent DNA helicase RecQ [Frondihabitans sp. PhB188]